MLHARKCSVLTHQGDFWTWKQGTWLMSPLLDCFSLDSKLKFRGKFFLILQHRVAQSNVLQVVHLIMQHKKKNILCSRVLRSFTVRIMKLLCKSDGTRVNKLWTSHLTDITDCYGQVRSFHFNRISLELVVLTCDAL